MCRDAVCHPLYREEGTLFCVENTISLPYGEGVGQSHAIRTAQTDCSRPQVKRYTRLVLYYYYTRTIQTHYPLYRAAICHPLEDTLPSTRNRGTLSHLSREGTLSSVHRRSLPPLQITEGHSILCGEKSLSPLHGEGGCLFYR